MFRSAFRPFFSRKRFGSSDDAMAVTSRRARDDDADRGDASSALSRGGPARYDLRDPRVSASPARARPVRRERTPRRDAMAVSSGSSIARDGRSRFS